jgi:hypothetical protein
MLRHLPVGASLCVTKAKPRRAAVRTLNNGRRTVCKGRCRYEPSAPPHRVPYEYDCTGLVVMSCQRLPRLATRVPAGHLEFSQTGTVSPSVDHKKVAPSTGLGQAGRGHVAKDLFAGVLEPAEHPFRQKEGADVTRVPAPVTRHTAPRRGSSSHAGRCFVDGAFVLSGAHPGFPLGEGVGMT